MGAVTDSIIARGDLAHLALFLWASGASALAGLARFNRRYSGDDP